MKISELLMLCFYVLSSIAETMDRIYPSGIDMTQYKLKEKDNIEYKHLKIMDSVCADNNHDSNTKAIVVSQTIKSFENPKEQVVTTQKYKNNPIVKKEMQIDVKRHITKEGKLDILS